MQIAAQKARFAKLILEGLTSKAAAARVGVSEKTACTWKKSLPVITYAHQRKILQKLLGDAMANPDPSSFIINRLLDASVKLEKCIFYQTHSRKSKPKPPKNATRMLKR